MSAVDGKGGDVRRLRQIADDVHGDGVGSVVHQDGDGAEEVPAIARGLVFHRFRCTTNGSKGYNVSRRVAVERPEGRAVDDDGVVVAAGPIVDRHHVHVELQHDVGWQT